VALVNSKLRNAAGETTMFVHPSCAELIEDFEQVKYRADSSSIDKEEDSARSHLSDALGYLTWEEFGEKQKAGEQRERLL
jgi:phage terminase large subunit